MTAFTLCRAAGLAMPEVVVGPGPSAVVAYATRTPAGRPVLDVWHVVVDPGARGRTLEVLDDLEAATVVRARDVGCQAITLGVRRTRRDLWRFARRRPGWRVYAETDDVVWLTRAVA